MTTPSTITNKAMVDQIEIDGAACRIRNGELEYQARSGDEFLWWVAHYDTGADGWGGEIVAAPTDADAYEIARHLWPRACFPANPVFAHFDTKPIGWSVSQETAAKCWAGQILATKHIARRFSMRIAAE